MQAYSLQCTLNSVVYFHLKLGATTEFKTTELRVCYGTTELFPRYTVTYTLLLNLSTISTRSHNNYSRWI